ncbi:uncharacterized protein LOC118188099 isoform X2 [Stegodyphus dumicola]|uniref:uncharacterized protein LOC118188099 isoform X2 n=1 Tax=Stegodyphus dumicola TaxID=202533 RepID=UPI0015B24AF8|nr:uncharacterized protein LOC118188099 isoform X2 [Stegodyphus dumicola]
MFLSETENCLTMTSLLQDHSKLIQRLALLAYVHRGEESKDVYSAVILGKILKEFYDDCVQQDDTSKLREETILAIAQYVKDHPRASERELQKEIERQIALFVEKIR